MITFLSANLECASIRNILLDLMLKLHCGKRVNASQNNECFRHAFIWYAIVHDV